MSRYETELNKLFEECLDRVSGGDIDEFFGEKGLFIISLFEKRNFQIKLEKLNKENYEMD